MVSQATAPTAKTVSTGVRLGYAVGSFCTANFSTLPGLLLLIYLTNVLAVDPLIAGVVVFLPKAWDLIANLLVGQWSDRTVSRWGPRRPWMLAGTFVLPAAFAVMFIGPGLTGVPAAVFVGLAFLVAATGYALYEVPYKAMPAEMTDDYHERTSLLTWRMIFIAIGIAMSGILAPILAGDTVEGYRTMGFVFAGIILIAMIASLFGTAKAPYTGQRETEPSLRVQIAAARQSKPFLWLLGLSSFQTLASFVMLAGAPYFASYTLDSPAATTTLFAALVGPMLVTMPLWTWLSRRFDKKGAMQGAQILFTVCAVAAVATPWLGSIYAHVVIVLVGFGYAGLQLLQFSMLADVIAHDGAVTGKRRGGVFTGLWTAFENVVGAAGAAVYAITLKIGGFLESDPAHPVTQPDSAHVAVIIGLTLVPAVIMLPGLWMTAKYNLTAETMAEVRKAAERPAS